MGKKIQVETDEFVLRPEKSEVERLWAYNEKQKNCLVGNRHTVVLLVLSLV